MFVLSLLLVLFSTQLALGDDASTTTTAVTPAENALRFIAKFTKNTKEVLEAFATMLPIVYIDTPTTPTAATVFAFIGEDGGVRYAAEMNFLSLPAAVVVERYGIVSYTVEVPGSRPTEPSRLPVPSSPVPVEGAFVSVISYEVTYYYRDNTSAARLLPWYNQRPQKEQLEWLGAMLFSDSADIYTRVDILSSFLQVGSSYILTLRFNDKSEEKEPSNSVLYTLLSNPSTQQRICRSLPGCVSITTYNEVPHPINSAQSFEQQVEEGQSQYSRQKIGFLVALILILLFFVAATIVTHRLMMRRLLPPPTEDSLTNGESSAMSGIGRKESIQ